MPLIRLTYAKDVAKRGTDRLEVSDLTARVLIEKRRAVLDEPLELATAGDDVCADCPNGGCAWCDVAVDGP